MNFMLIHFLVKSFWTLLLVVAQIAWHQLQSRHRNGNNETFNHPLGVSSKTDVLMNTVEEQQVVSSLRGLMQRRSFHNLAEQSGAKDVGSAAMSCQGSSQSQKSSLSLASDVMDEKMTMGQPSNFGTVVPGVYRSSYPQEASYPFIQKLRLKTIM